ncbi:YigZ family protein [Kineococcus sp. TRM81007]|uniref:YigZ family protein n=1 Tax=Kineococcus sp. TRM81007 TaxID=2925831 RepID=UPI001F595A67|nr:YigZ family protein [Kineococcus sp. TRM81007]MCI2240483.1 YigZ family protein [Kineococcus sp. TRM81007]
MRTETVVERSRFLCVLQPVPDEAAADAVVAAARREFPDARHHCTARVLGDDGEVRRASDDGEPAGTAGAPMLAALDGAGVTGAVAVVVRWFGGVLLGTGGLVRAYGGAVAGALAEAGLVQRQRVDLVQVRAPLAEAGRVEAELRRRHAVEDVAWGADGWRAVVAVPAGGRGGLEAELAAAGLAAPLTDALVDLGPAVRPLT